MMQKIGSWSFIIGVVLAIIIGLLGNGVFGADIGSMVPLVFLILGILIGVLNIGDKEVQSFLLAVVALMVAGAVNWTLIPTIGVMLGSIFQNITTLMAPAAIIVGIKSVWNLAQH